MEQPLWEYKGKKYYIEGIAEFKCLTTRKWLPCYIYVAVENGKRYCREKEDFNEKFKAI